MNRIAIGGAILALAMGAWWWTTQTPQPPLPGPAASTPIASAPPAASVEARGLPTLAPMLRKAMPAVVSITVQSRVPNQDNPLFKDPYYRRFFGNEPLPERRVQSAGSGVVIAADQGLILTNNHVVQNAERIGIMLADGRRIEAKLVGTDPATDVALLSVNAQGLVTLPLGNSDELQIGDYVVAIGNPFGLGQTVTAGIISALGRSGLGIEGYEDFIQTDATINPGNSGGALVDIDGRLIGINTAIVGPAGGNVGIGFAIPINMARDVAEQLRRFGKVARGQLGVTISDHPGDMPVGTRADTSAGAMIAEVARGSPAEKAGLKPGDLIIAVNGNPIVNSAQLRARVGRVRVDENIELEFLRGADRITLTVRIAAPAG
jgi:Do/DeqQ family serine protease